MCKRHRYITSMSMVRGHNLSQIAYWLKFCWIPICISSTPQCKVFHIMSLYLIFSTTGDTIDVVGKPKCEVARSTLWRWTVHEFILWPSRCLRKNLSVPVCFTTGIYMTLSLLCFWCNIDILSTNSWEVTLPGPVTKCQWTKLKHSVFKMDKKFIHQEIRMYSTWTYPVSLCVISWWVIFSIRRIDSEHQTTSHHHQ